MKSQTTTIITGTLLLAMTAAMTIPTRLEAQEQKEQAKAHHHYKLIDMGTFGGHNGGIVNPSAGTLNGRGALVGAADTADVDPFAPNMCFTNCRVNRGFVWQDGVRTELGSLPGGASSIPSAINDHEQVVGQAQDGSVDPQTGWPETRGVLWQHGGITELPTFGGTQGIANAINDRGEAVGAVLTATADPFANSLLVGCWFLPSTTFSLCSNGTFATNAVFFPGTTETHAFLWRHGSMHDLGTLGGPDSAAWIINDRGEVAGWSFTSFVANGSTGVPTMAPFLWSPAKGKMINLGSLGGSFGAPFWMNNRGVVVGTSNLAGDNANHPFLWDDGTLKDLGTFGGSFGTAYSVNDAGEVVGTASIESGLIFAFSWKDGVLKNLGTVDGDQCSQAFSINSKSQIVGVSDSCDTGADLHGFISEDGAPIADLNQLLVPGADLMVVSAVIVNDRGEIGCLGTLPNGDTHACLLIPCDEDHPNMEGCDYDPVVPAVAAQAPTAPLALNGAATSSQPVFSPAERIAQIRSMMERRRGRLGALPRK
jgi:probable HAF family extracellular repeat protein